MTGARCVDARIRIASNASKATALRSTQIRSASAGTASADWQNTTSAPVCRATSAIFDLKNKSSTNAAIFIRQEESYGSVQNSCQQYGEDRHCQPRHTAAVHPYGRLRTQGPAIRMRPWAVRILFDPGRWRRGTLVHDTSLVCGRE